MTEPVRLSLKVKEIPLELEDESGRILNYTLRELKGADRDTFTQAMDRRQIKNDKGEVVGFRDHKNLLSNLLTISVYDDKGKQVPEATIQQWPTSTQFKLVEMATELSGLGNKLPKVKDELKNGSLESDEGGSNLLTTSDDLSRNA